MTGQHQGDQPGSAPGSSNSSHCACRRCSEHWDAAQCDIARHAALLAELLSKGRLLQGMFETYSRHEFSGRIRQCPTMPLQTCHHILVLPNLCTAQPQDQAGTIGHLLLVTRISFMSKASINTEHDAVMLMVNYDDHICFIELVSRLMLLFTV